VTLRLPDDPVLVAHIPKDEIDGAGPGDAVSVELRRPKAFRREEAGLSPDAPEAVPTP
jgi:hypothetical protein